jgi:hypothetical protein
MFDKLTVGAVLRHKNELRNPKKKEPTKIYWLGSHKCDFAEGHAPFPCQHALPSVQELEFLVDGKTKMGPWATMCQPCHKSFGIGLGTGKGQMYERQEDGRFLKVEG